MQDSKRDIDVKNRLLDSVGEGEGGMIWENSIETCIICEIDHWSRSHTWNRVLGAGARDDPEGWDGKGGGVQDGEHMYTHGWLMWMYGYCC